MADELLLIFGVVVLILVSAGLVELYGRARACDWERVFAHMGRSWCGLTRRHAYIQHFELQRTYLVCLHCGKETAGVDLSPASRSAA